MMIYELPFIFDVSSLKKEALIGQHSWWQDEVGSRMWVSESL